MIRRLNRWQRAKDVRGGWTLSRTKKQTGQSYTVFLHHTDASRFCVCWVGKTIEAAIDNAIKEFADKYEK